MSTPIVTFRDVSYQYAATESPALRGVSLEIFEGEYIGLMGLNGAGKTSLGLCLNGVIPHMLMGDFTGEVTVGDVNTADYPVREMSKLVGMVFDNPEFQMSQLTVGEEVALGLESLGTPPEEMRPIVAESLELVGLAGLEDRSPLELSGGQQQRLAVAAVLAMKPSILFMDEPTSNLDPVGKTDLFEIAARLNRDHGMTVVVAEHEVEVLAEYADRILVMADGELVMAGSPTEVLTRVDELNALGLRVPEATQMAKILERDYGLWTGEWPTTLEQALPATESLISKGVSGE